MKHLAIIGNEELSGKKFYLDPNLQGGGAQLQNKLEYEPNLKSKAAFKPFQGYESPLTRTDNFKQAPYQSEQSFQVKPISNILFRN